MALEVVGMPAWDRSKALSLMANDSVLLGEIVELVVGVCPGQLSMVRAAIDAGDPAALGNACHNLVATVGSLLAEPTLQVAKDLHAIARKGDLSNALEKYGELESCLLVLRAELVDFLASRAPQRTSGISENRT